MILFAVLINRYREYQEENKKKIFVHE